jgi:hypothetical protein
MPKFTYTITLDDGRHKVYEIEASDYDEAKAIIHEEHISIEEEELPRFKVILEIKEEQVLEARNHKEAEEILREFVIDHINEYPIKSRHHKRYINKGREY